LRIRTDNSEPCARKKQSSNPTAERFRNHSCL
jgi:hypothetical protein